ncbi:unnamed protein product [Phyllotreta striolata]|uniref:Nucleoside transporter n=1 Tax=Phyllotreta striolata TaxID=444603 RepID=A0A9N9TSM1_PHYSR|nr:unnamed protein product [Phyllotreta striolata]
MTDPDGPKDKFYIVYFICLLHGVGTLTAWNMFINARDYFKEYKLSDDYIGYHYPHGDHFMQYLSFFSMFPALAFMWINIFVRLKSAIVWRIILGIGVLIAIMTFTLVMAIFNTSHCPNFFFIVTMISVFLINSASSVYQSTLFGIVGKLPQKYMTAIVIGNNVCGTFTSIISILTKVASTNYKTAAIYYFMIAIIILSGCFASFFIVVNNEFYKYYDQKENAGVMKGEELPPYWTIFKTAFPQLLNIIMVFIVTLTLFPSMQAEIVKKSPSFFVPDKYYADIMCFLNFNVFAMIGSFIPVFFVWPEPKWVWLPVSLRFLYIPLMLFCNYQIQQAERALPVFFNDYVYFVFGSTMALTSGYFSSVASMYAPKTVEEKHSMVAAANSVYQSTLFGIVGKLPEKYMTAIVIGNEFSGTFTSIVSIVSKVASTNYRIAAIYYFLISIIILGVCFASLFMIVNNDFYKYYDEKENAGEHKGEELPPYWQIFKTAFPQLLNIILVFIVTLTVFPSLEAEVYKSDPNFFIPDEYYADIMCFLTFNIFATTGSFLPVFFVWPKPKWVWIPVTLRFLYIPLLLFCNYQIQQAERTLPVLFNDYVFFILGATMALTNGYFATISSMYAPKTVEEKHSMVAGMFSGASFLTGINIGVWISFIWPTVATSNFKIPKVPTSEDL